MRLTSVFGVIAVVLLVVMAVTAFTGNIDKKTADTDPTIPVEESYADGEEDTADDYADPAAKVSHLNDKLQNNGTHKDDYNFGKNPKKKIKALMAKGYSEDEATFMVFKEYCKDSLILAANIGTDDESTGTRLIGDFYSLDCHDWAQTLSDFIDEADASPAFLNTRYKKYFSRIAETAEYEVVDLDDEDFVCEDQFYAEPAKWTAIGRADLIVMATNSHGKYLKITYHIKQGKISTYRRIACGFQPANVAELMNLPVEERSSVGPSKKGNNSGSKPGTGGNPTSPTKPTNPTKPTKPSGGDGCKDEQTWTPSGGQQRERTTTDPTGGGNGTDNRNDPPSGGATRVDQGSGGGDRTPEPPKNPPAVDPGNGKVDGGDD